MISVAMATFNGEKYIERQLKSILCQLNEDDEIIISDDGSSDGTLDIVKRINDKRILILNGPQKGLNANFENAIKRCSGDYIFICDQDDYWYENKVEKVKKIFENRNVSVVQHDARIIDDNDNIVEESFAKYRRVRNGVLKNWLRGTFHGCCMAFKRELVDNFLPIEGQTFLYDQWIGIIAEMNQGVYFMNEVLIDYRRHSNNASSFKQLKRTEQIRNRVNLMGQILKYRIGRAK